MNTAVECPESSRKPKLTAFPGLLTIACSLFAMASFDAAAQAQVTYLNVDRQIFSSAFAPDGVNDQQFLNSQETGLLSIDASVSGPPDASANASASQNLILTPTGLQASGSFSAAATANTLCCSQASSGTDLFVTILYQGTSSRAFTVTGEVSAQSNRSESYPAISSYLLNAFGQGVTALEGAETLSFSGFMEPGRSYTVSANVVGSAGIEVDAEGSGGLSGQTSTGSFNLAVEFATTEIDCNNGFDDDGDGLIDGDDPDCSPPEICDNGLDDDGNGLIDGDDPACFEPIGLQVSCMHSPIYPQDGDEVTITATAIDAQGNLVTADKLDIYVNDLNAPYDEGGNSGRNIAFYTASNAHFSYGCRVEKSFESAQSWRLEEPVLRTVDTGVRQNPDWAAQPVLYNGPTDEKLDIVFFHDDDEYTSFQDPNFLSDVYDLVNDGLWSIPWFVEHQWVFNIWIATTNTANASPEPGPLPPNQNIPSCARDRPNEIRNIFNTDYKFRDAGGIVHRSNCRDNAGNPRMFTIQAGAGAPAVVLAHEMGHRPFGLADEYCRQVAGATVCDGGHFRSDPFANIYKNESSCRNNAGERPYEADDCRVLVEPGGQDWWIGEFNYNNLSQSNQPLDLMQQTGIREYPPGSGQMVIGYDVGLTEINRMNWLVQRCLEGKCGGSL